MPIRVKPAVACLAFALACCAGSTAVYADDAPPSQDGAADASQPGASSGRTVRTELEYLTSRQAVDPRKASKADDAEAATEEVATAAPARTNNATGRASRASRPANASAKPVVSVSTGGSGKGRDMSSALVKEKSEHSTSRNRKKAHKSSSWSLSFLFSGLRDVIVSGRVQYLPLLGAAPVRFRETGEFDRSRIVGLREYDERMEEIAVKTKPAVAKEDEAAGGVAGSGGAAATLTEQGSAAALAGSLQAGAGTVAGTGAGDGNSSAASLSQEPGNGGANASVSEVTSARSNPKVATTSSASASGVEYVPVSSEVVMKYFDNGNPGAQVKVGMPFVMPYQSEQPLMMDSSAKYTQTEGGTQNGTSAK